ncbi:MAG: soluble lytic transglycosylase, partial [Cyanobacteriota bacterium]
MLESPVRPKQPKQPKPNQLHLRKRLPLRKQHQLVVLVLFCSLGWFALRSCQARFFKSGQQTQTASLISLRSQTPTARQSQLIALMNQPERGLSPQQLRDRQRAHYLLATDLVQQGKGKQALGYLQELS